MWLSKIIVPLIAAAATWFMLDLTRSFGGRSAFYLLGAALLLAASAAFFRLSHETTK